ncbi:SDR family NAD(P)-dependent oxidoreductase [Phytohabitans kaempferiae]|uniref:SDR family NAD(P)-dependent oxidoreductase n=1 Tax=Phytohabitans kaempferiae TaxID=1620943 RepID=A0ABV6MAE7_9ACTN
MTATDPPGVALVTGAARGLGLAVAERLARRGDHVVLTDVDLAAARAAAGGIATAGGLATAVALDVTDAAQVEKVVAHAGSIGPLTTVVNNAGIAFAAPIADTDLDDFDRLMAVNVRGAFCVLRAAVRAMLPRRHGWVVNVCSTSSFTASSSPMLAYDTSKAALRMMTQAAARELGPTGIRVNAVAPGTMDTALVRGLFDRHDGLDDLAAARIPLGRLGRTEEVAEAVAFLSCPASSYVTGHVLVADGGWLT